VHQKVSEFDTYQVQTPAAPQNAAYNRGEDVQEQPTVPPAEKSSELKAFLFLTVVMAPVLAGVVIGTYGLLVWIYQMFMGPPTG
jgi:periplasmic nitrate reductase NapE